MPSPYCPGRSIASCPSGAARKLEDDIYELALAGQPREEIEATLVARFGREKMGYEQSTGMFVLVTIMAVTAIAAIFALGRRSATRAAAMATAPGDAGRCGGVSQAELDDLEDDLEALDGI